MAALFRQRDAFTLVLTVKGPGGSLNTQDKAGRPVAAVGHYHEDMMAAYHPPGIVEKLLPHLHQRRHSSVFMIVGDTETSVTFESQR